MNILGYKSGGHDGTLCSVQDGTMQFSIEAEKDSGLRHALFDREKVSKVLTHWGCKPEIACGDSRRFGGAVPDNYMGHVANGIVQSEIEIAQRKVPYYSIPHEMSHIACSYALSDLPERTPFYALVWEAYLGRFYRVDEHFSITKLGVDNHVMDFVGVRYSLPYHATARSDIYGLAAAGKIMALAGLAEEDLVRSDAIRELTDQILDAELTNGSGRIALDGNWRCAYEAFEKYRDSSVTDAQFVAICKALQNGVFDRFAAFAQQHMTERLPLVIAGGCGLNCDWNTMWRDSGLFESVFVPPVTNDTGIALGAAAIAQHRATGKMKVAWDVYAGEEFVHEAVDFAAHDFIESDLNYATVVEWLTRGMVIAWVQGRYEIGPRALCHRSLIAAPFARSTQDELNRIKHRESFRPVAPVCIEEDVAKHFVWSGPSPHMLYFQRVRSAELQAVTHTDGTARVQTLTRTQDSATYELLCAFREKTGYGVLCNTSLNFLGRGFINRTSELVKYVNDTGIHAMVIQNKMYIRAAHRSGTIGN
jgi:hydroxymethyl cephem carbamoyltransferase